MIKNSNTLFIVSFLLAVYIMPGKNIKGLFIGVRVGAGTKMEPRKHY